MKPGHGTRHRIFFGVHPDLGRILRQLSAKYLQTLTAGIVTRCQPDVDNLRQFVVERDNLFLFFRCHGLSFTPQLYHATPEILKSRIRYWGGHRSRQSKEFNLRILVPYAKTV